MKYLGINLTKYVHDWQAKNYKIPMKQRRPNKKYMFIS